MLPELELDVERPVAGGRMIARHEGRIVFVGGAIPGERVRARIERTTRGVLWADVTDVITPSPHRRALEHDPACGGQLYRHIDPAFQRQLKSDIVTDAFRRVGKIHLEAPTPVEASPERGYRLRAQLHVHGGRAGFFRAGTHQWCDAAATDQLLPDAMPAVEALLAAHPRFGETCRGILLAENIRASQRVLHLVGGEGLHDPAGTPVALPPGVSGVTADGATTTVTLAGAGAVADTADDLFGEDPPVPGATRWARHARAFFQGNRYLTGALVRHVLQQVPGDVAIDLYAGVGLFAVGLLARGARVVAVESDAAALADLWTNTRPWAAAATVEPGTVETTLPALRARPASTIVLDPPRTGVSPQALAAIAALGSPWIVYVSCDAPTLARDTAKLIAAGYRLDALRAFDLFPNTAHVEVVATFRR
jgi:23S rRNA (uracil1939-C5)-methyltransferase